MKRVAFKKPIPIPNSTAWVQIDTPIVQACAKESSRYAIDKVEIVPSDDGTVMAQATNEYMAVVKQYDGVASGKLQIPRQVLPQARGTVSLDRDVWKNPATSKYADNEKADGFPPVIDVLPDVKDTHVHICLSPKLLLALANAMGCDQVVLMVDREKLNDLGLPTRAICVAHPEANAIGVLMPANPLQRADKKYMGVKAKLAKAVKGVK